MRADFSIQLHEVISSNQDIKETISAFSKRLTLAESCNSKAEDDILGLSDKEKSIQKKVQELTLKLHNLENRHRNSNLRLTGLPKKAKDGDVVAFLQTLLPKSLDQTHFQNPLLLSLTTECPVYKTLMELHELSSWSFLAIKIRFE